jgi:hypothetical protein
MVSLGIKNIMEVITKKMPHAIIKPAQLLSKVSGLEKEGKKGK